MILKKVKKSCLFSLIALIIMFAVVFSIQQLIYSEYVSFILIVSILYISVISVSFYFLYFTDYKIENVFLPCFILLGIIYIFIITPFAVPDEQYHWAQTIRLTNYIFEDTNNINNFNLSDYYIEGISNHNNVRDVYTAIPGSLFVSDNTVAEYHPIQWGHVYPVQYLPAATGLSIGRALPTSKLLQFYFGCLSNLLFSGILLHKSIKIIPMFKPTIFAVCLMPMFLQQTTSYNYDAFINSMAILLIAFTLREIYSEEKVKTYRLILIAVISALLAPAKYVYSFLIFSILLIPDIRYYTKKEKYIKSIITIVTTFISAITSYIIFSPQSSIGFHLPYDTYTTTFFLQNPFQAISILLNTTLSQIPRLVEMCFGRYLCGLTLPINSLLISSFIILFSLTFFTHEDSIDIIVSKKQRLFFIMITVAVYFSVLYAILIDHTPNNSPMVTGVQGRYFIPLLLPIAIIFRNKLFIHSNKTEKLLLLTIIIMNCFATYDIVNKTISGIYVNAMH